LGSISRQQVENNTKQINIKIMTLVYIILALILLYILDKGLELRKSKKPQPKATKKAVKKKAAKKKAAKKMATKKAAKNLKK